jgi:hypothetical protein
MTQVIARNDDGGYTSTDVADLDAVVAASGGGLDLTDGEVSLAANTDGLGLVNTSGVLSVSLPGMGAKVAISTAGAGVLTAAGIVAGLIMRTGPGGAYEDTTDTATAILALLKDPAVGMSWEFTIVNGVAHAETFTAGAGVTAAGVVNNAASKVRRYRATVTNVGTPAVLITGVGEMVA